MRLIWADQAIESVDSTADYIENLFGTERCLQFYEEVQRQADLLVKHPELGPVDDDLKGGRYDYRSLGINELSRLIYRIDGDTIRVLYLWNTRKDPLRHAKMFL